MKLAIHNRENSFSDKWVEYCKKYNIAYELVDCYASDIIKKINGCDGLMWHWPHHDYKAQLFARQLIYSLEQMGMKVFPNSKTCWHYDDKVGQKYLLECINAPLVPSYIFYDKSQALDLAASTTYPKVFKLRSGAGSKNVQLVPDFHSAAKLIRQAFSQGFKASDRWMFLAERLWHFKRDRNIQSFFNISRGVGRLLIPSQAEIHLPLEKNYAYFQDFIPDNDHDIRIMVIGGRAFGFKRMVREGDFRASGSGVHNFCKSQISELMLSTAMSVSKKLLLQSVAIDFVTADQDPLIVEISYCFANKAYREWPGYWDNKFEWIEGNFKPEYFMIDDFVNSIKLKD